jgi:hypothetical protein
MPNVTITPTNASVMTQLRKMPLGVANQVARSLRPTVAAIGAMNWTTRMFA